MNKQDKVYNKLNELGINYDVTHHEAAFTVEDMDDIKMPNKGAVVKNLFLRDSKGKRHFLVTLDKNKKVDLKDLRSKLGSSALSFASEERLTKHLNLTKGSVTPLGVINNDESNVEVVIDNDLSKEPLLGVHPNDNTATVWISFENLKKVIDHSGNPIMYVTI